MMIIATENNLSDSAGIPDRRTMLDKKSVKKVKLSTNPVTTPTGLAIPALTPPMPEDRTMGRMGRMHGESIVTTPARNENKISKIINNKKLHVT